jgi:hypothetical protein
VAAALREGIKAHRRSLLVARAWLWQQPNDAHRIANFSMIQAQEQQLRLAEQQLVRTGIAE